MSKWMKKHEEMFDDFRKKKEKEGDKPSYFDKSISDMIWPTPQPGTQQKAKQYVGRFLVDPKSNFYISYIYHMFKDKNGKWVKFICPKTFDKTARCAMCGAVGKLFQGNKDDKQVARTYMKKNRNCGNWFVISDPRDEGKEAEDKAAGRVWIYDFPDDIEKKLKAQIIDTEEGRGYAIFDPGEDGFNFLLNVLSKKPTADGKVFPDYNTSEFSSKAKPIAKSDEKIQEIMDTCYDLEEYIGFFKKTEEDIIDLVKQEELWDLISDEYGEPVKKVKSSFAKKSSEMDDFPGESETEKKEEKETSETEEKPSEPEKGEVTDQDLLDQLNGL